MVKVAAKSNAGDGYFWFEIESKRVLAEGTGQPICAQCHAQGSDFILTPFPLR